MRYVRVFALGLLAAASFMLAACTGDDAFQKQAYTLGKSYALAQKGAITYLEVAQPSQEVKDKINRADDKAAPLVIQVLECAKSMLGESPPPDPEAEALGLDGEEAQAAECQGYLNEALLALNALRKATEEE